MDCNLLLQLGVYALPLLLVLVTWRIMSSWTSRATTMSSATSVGDEPTTPTTPTAPDVLADAVAHYVEHGYCVVPILNERDLAR